MNLNTLRARVAADLDDAGYAVWTEAEIDGAIRQALEEYGAACPRRLSATLPAPAGSRELDLSALAGLAGVERVSYPYDAGAPADLPRWRRWELWPGGLLFLDLPDPPAAGESVRVFYWAGHTIDGLDGAAATSVPAQDEHVLVLGAAGYAALQKSRAAIDSLGLSSYTPLQWRTWAETRLDRYRQRLAECAGRHAAAECGPAPMDAPARGSA